MHDHATDGGPHTFDASSTARALRLHLDNSHDQQTSGLDFAHLVERHRKAHKDARLAEIEAAANLIGERLAAAPPAVVESIVTDELYLTDANGTVYLAEPVDVWDVASLRGEGAPSVYRLTAQVPPAEPAVDLLEATKASLAATRAYLAANLSEGATPCLPRPADRPASSDAARSGGAS